MSITVIQVVSQDNVTASLTTARCLLEQVTEGGARLTVLLEDFAAMGRCDLAEPGYAEARGNGPILPWLDPATRDLRLQIVAGTLLLLPGGQPEAKANACSLLIDEYRERAVRHDKLHLSDVDIAGVWDRYRESGNYAFGQKIMVADMSVGRLGLTVCYDLRFPGLYTALRGTGAESITTPSAFTAVTNTVYWQASIRAHTIRAQCYLLAAGQDGVHPRGREMFDHSAIVDPWGRALAEWLQDEAALSAARGTAGWADIRRRMPVVAYGRFFLPAELRPVRME